MEDENHWFIKGIYFARRYFRWLSRDNDRWRRYFSEDYLEDLEISGLNIKPFEILSFSYMIFFLVFIGFIMIDLFIIFIYYSQGLQLDIITLILMFLVTLLIPFIAMNLIAVYPRTIARYTRIHSIGDIPEILSYLVMYLKLVPNLENSIKFTAKESSTTLTRALRKMIWDMEIRVYHGVNDAITHFANKWGKHSDHLKRALHLIRSSIDEPEEAQRIITLNKALDVGLDGTRYLMNEFASKLHQPTLIIYSIGVMIPLSLIAMLPATALIGMNITIFQIFILYDIILPVILYLYMRSILLSRPATFNPPIISKEHPYLKNMNKHRSQIIAVILGLAITIPYILFGIPGIPMVFFPIWGLTIAITYYTISVYRPYKKIRDDIRSMEEEFTDALYILGKRISEEKSPEESFIYTAETMRGSKIAEIFNRIGYNLTALHTNLHDALFHPEYGSLKYVYSSRIRAIMHLFIEGIKKSHKSASISIIKLADHLKELQEVEKRIKETLGSLTATLRSTAAFFAPLIAGVTLAITKVVTLLINRLNNNSIVAKSSMFNVFSIENIQPEYFILVIGIYIIELVILLTRFTNGIDEGDDRAEYMYNLGRTLPIAVATLTITVILSQMFFSKILAVI